jgi:hypothetical protein
MGTQLRLDANVLEGLAELICGDSSDWYYRQGYKLPKFFEGAGWRNVGECDGYRRQWTLDQLKERAHDPSAMQQVVERLADSREYLDEPEARAGVVKELNRLLETEGYYVDDTGHRPSLRQVGATATKRPPEVLRVNLGTVVNDKKFGEQLQGRLTEAHSCWESGAHTAAVIMLGSVLEGVLYDVAHTRTAEGKAPTDALEKLIAHAYAEGWISKDLSQYADILRGQRNLVHPRRQYKDDYTPNDDTTRIAWNVVVATLNQLS